METLTILGALALGVTAALGVAHLGVRAILSRIPPRPTE